MKKSIITSALHWGIRILVVINLGISISYIGLWAIAAQNNVLWRADFTIYYTAWDIIRDGQGAQLYNLDTQTTHQLNLLQGNHFMGNLLPYDHPPYMALALYPLSWFSLQTAYWIFAFIQILVLGRLLYLLISIAHSQEWSRTERLVFTITFCALPPLFTSLLLGNITMFVLWGWIELYRAIKLQRDRSAALSLIIAAAKPQHAVFYGLTLLVARRWKTLFMALGLMSILVLFSTLVLGAALWPDYIRLLFHLSSAVDQYGIYIKDMVNLKGLLLSILGKTYSTSVNLVNLLALVASALGVAWLWRGRWEVQNPAFELKLALSLTLGLMFSPHALVQDALLLAFPVFLFYLYLRQHLSTQAQLLVWFVLGSPLLLLISEFLLPLHVPFLFMLGLAVWIIRVLRSAQSKSLIAKP